jgi:ABC-2 type transport system permease protein
MKQVIAIMRKELASYFNSPIAYIVLGVFLVTAGWLFFYFSGLFIVGKASMRAFFSFSPLLFMFVVPAITMRLIAEERKSGTLEGLLTLPVTEAQIVLGKFFAALAMICVGLAFTLFYPFSLVAVTAPGNTFDWGPVIGGYVGLVLLAGAFIAVGMWASALSKNQIVGFIAALALCFVLWVLDKAILILPASIGAVFQYLSVTYHFENVARGVIDSRDLLYYVTLTTIGLLLTTRALSSVRK